MLIEQISLHRFMGFTEFTLGCSNFTALVGLNNSGKTSILRAIEILHRLALHNGNPQESADVGLRSGRTYLTEDDAHRFSPHEPLALWLYKDSRQPFSLRAQYTGGYEVIVELTGDGYLTRTINHQDKNIGNDIGLDEHKDFLNYFSSLKPFYAPPVGSASPVENRLKYPELVAKQSDGDFNTTWRNMLYWLVERGRKIDFESVSRFAEGYMPGTKIQIPRVSPTHREEIVIEYEQDSQLFDIGVSGSGYRLLVNIGSVLYTSGSKCLLFDEPDAHLHSSLQRLVAQALFDFAAVSGTQIFVSTHSPDFLREIPLENLVWIDRYTTQGQPCNQLVQFLELLGAVTSVEAINHRSANKVLFIEGNADPTVLQALFACSGHRSPFDDPKVVVAKLSGKANTMYAKQFPVLLRSAFSFDVRVACLTDNDYELPNDDATKVNANDPESCFVMLNRKEIENFIIEPRVVATTARKLAEESLQYKPNQDLRFPTEEDVQTKLEQILNESEVRDLVKNQLTPRYREQLDRRLDPSTKEALGDEWFTQNWNDPGWRVRNCPGKLVLKKLRDWCQQEYGLTLSTRRLAANIGSCPTDFVALAARIEGCLWP